MNFRSTVSSSTSTRRRSGFTLVEILVVLGIIGLILSIALPITFKARRQAARTRAVRDLEAIRTALEEFKNSYGEYPQTSGGKITFPATAKDGATILCEALTGQFYDLTAGPPALKPILDPKSGRPRSPLINIENFNIRTSPPSLVGSPPLVCLRDTSDVPILYFPARVPPPDYRQNNLFVSTSANSLYNYNDCPFIPPSVTQRYLPTIQDMEYLLGDGTKGSLGPPVVPPVPPNGMIDGRDIPACTGPYLLWSAGANVQFGLNPRNKSDDVTNFPTPVEFAE